MTIKQLQEKFPRATIETWHHHENGGGWIENTAKVEPTVYLESTAQVFGDARVSDWLCS